MAEDTIAAISTSVGEGPIGIIRLSGPDALTIADKIFAAKDGKKPSGFESHTVHYGHVVGSGKTIDEVLLTVMRAPRTYTREDIIEINCHGGIQASINVFDLVVKCGARIAQPGEFTKRAFLNGRIDLTQAEAVLDVIRAKTEGSLKVAVSQLEGGLSKEVNAIRDLIVDIASRIEASIDFSDEETDIIDNHGLGEKTKEALKKLEDLLKTYGEGLIMREGILAIICGKPNVGKSSLMNLLLKRDRVIVSHVPGTTRDAVEEMINLRGIPIRLVDTAGIAETEDIVEREGVKRTKIYLDLADLAIFVFDASTPIEARDIDLSGLIGGKKKIIVLNKIDLAAKTSAKELKELFRDDIIIELSVEKKKNIEALENAIAGSVWKGDLSGGEAAIVANARHKELIDKAFANMVSVSKAMEQNSPSELIAIDLKEAIFNLGLVVGKSVSDDVLDRIFEQFCIGK